MSGEFELENNEQLKNEIAGFEAMLRKNEERFYDVEQIEDITNYYLQQNELSWAERAVKLGLSQHPSSTELKLKLAQILSRKGKFQDALKSLEEITLLEFNNPELYLFKAEIYSELQDYDHAIENFLEAINYTAEEEHDYIYVDIAAEFQNKGDFEKARHYLKKAILLNPYNDLAYLELLFTMQIEEKVEDAVTFFQQVIDIDPYNHVAWYYLGLSFQDMELYEKAIEAFDYAGVVKDDFVDAYIQKAECYIALEYYRNAITPLKEAIAHTDNVARIYYTLGECYENLEEYERAIEYYQECLKTNEDIADAWIGIGVCLAHMHRLREGFEYVKRALSIDSDNNEFLLIYAEFLRDLGNYGEAEAVYEKLMDVYPDSLDVWLDASELYYRMDDYERATGTISEGIKHMPSFVELTYRLAGYLYLRGYIQEARRTFAQALETDFNKHKEFFTFFGELENDAQFVELINQYRPHGN